MTMSKKKIVSLCLGAILVVMAIAGASLAYLTDTKDATNTFTVGKVKIELIEKQRDGKGGLEDFEQEKKLMPIVGSAQGEKDALGLSVAKNYVDKIVTIKNLDNDAYVRAYIAVPAALDSEKASENILHINQPGKDTFVGLDGTTADKAYTWSDMTKVGTFTDDDGILYNVYYSTYADVLTKDEIAGCAAYVGVYLDKDVNFDGTNWTVTRNGVTSVIDYDLSNGVTLPVFAVGVQADGFDSADAAIDAAFGANFNPWAN